ncbi:hypothetical protein ACN08Y_08450 [Rothia sp. P5764]|uniref:hypothetical protein n=1 Tax=Rothia sp. P5764 TaxID=3402654 RepID=UPI003ACA3286
MQAENRHRRLTRGVLSACFALFMGLCFHLAGGGQVPPTPTRLLVPLALAILVCTLLAGTRKSLVRLTAGVAPSQFAFHTFLSAAEYAPYHPAHVIPSQAIGHATHHGVALSQAVSAEAPAHMHMVAPGYLSIFPAETQMFLAHALATVITVAVFYRYELVLEKLGTCLTYLWARLLSSLGLLVPLGYPRTSALCSVHQPKALPAITLTPHLLRGPPLFSFASPL